MAITRTHFAYRIDLWTDDEKEVVEHLADVDDLTVALAFALAEARAEGAWCILDSDGCTNCAFQTRAQCVASATGTGGSCVRNVNYSASADARARKRTN